MKFINKNHFNEYTFQYYQIVICVGKLDDESIKIQLKKQIDDFIDDDDLLELFRLTDELTSIINPQEYVEILNYYSTEHACVICQCRMLHFGHKFRKLFEKYWEEWFDVYEGERDIIVSQAVRLEINIDPNKLLGKIDIKPLEDKSFKNTDSRIIGEGFHLINFVRSTLINDYLSGTYSDEILDRVNFTNRSFNLLLLSGGPGLKLIEFIYSERTGNNLRYIAMEILIYRLETQKVDREQLCKILEYLIKPEDADIYPIYLIISFLIRLQNIKKENELQKIWISLWQYLFKLIQKNSNLVHAFGLIFQQIKDEDVLNELYLTFPSQIQELVHRPVENDISTTYALEIGILIRTHLHPNPNNISNLLGRLNHLILNMMEDYPIYSVAIQRKALHIIGSDKYRGFPISWKISDTTRDDFNSILSYSSSTEITLEFIEIIKKYPSIETFQIVMDVIGTNLLDLDLHYQILIGLWKIGGPNFGRIVISNFDRLLTELNEPYVFQFLHNLYENKYNYIDGNQRIYLATSTGVKTRAFLSGIALYAIGNNDLRVEIILTILSPFLPMMYKERLFKTAFQNIEKYLKDEIEISFYKERGRYIDLGGGLNMADFVLDFYMLQTFVINDTISDYIFEKSIELINYYKKLFKLSHFYGSKHFIEEVKRSIKYDSEFMINNE